MKVLPPLPVELMWLGPAQVREVGRYDWPSSMDIEPWQAEAMDGLYFYFVKAGFFSSWRCLYIGQSQGLVGERQSGHRRGALADAVDAWLRKGASVRFWIGTPVVGTFHGNQRGRVIDGLERWLIHQLQPERNEKERRDTHVPRALEVRTAGGEPPPGVDYELSIPQGPLRRGFPTR